MSHERPPRLCVATAAGEKVSEANTGRRLNLIELLYISPLCWLVLYKSFPLKSSFPVLPLSDFCPRHVESSDPCLVAVAGRSLAGFPTPVELCAAAVFVCLPAPMPNHPLASYTGRRVVAGSLWSVSHQGMLVA